ncbi:lipopolysaccharide biosynthesis protein [Deinococcus sp. Marseille-Q6407]|uniref:nucleotide-binding protein n=1 Tax=Deinococcus sp. Marseille-Q6407 TaxID=2969223 RepID=UPI0021C0BC05|nr:lipopolysaccharide biosynthesis protein [Deinococcus sp. Marseille-Q6407]
MTQLPSQAQDLDITALTRTLRSALLPVLLVATVLSALSYFYSQSRPPVYQASAGVAALPSAAGNSLLNSSLVTAPGLPAGVVSRALRSPEVTDSALKGLQQTLTDKNQYEILAAAVRQELHSGDYRTVTLRSEIDQNLVGNYEIVASAGTPEAAKATANAFARALLDWDRARALEGVDRARTNLLNQLEQLREQPTVGGQAVGQDTANQMRAEVARSLQQVEVLRLTASGTLSLISGAVLPADPVSPRPLRDAALVFGASLFFGILLSLLRDRLVQRVQDEEALRPFGLPILGLLPPLPGRRGQLADIGSFLQHGGFRESLEFVRLGLLASLNERGQDADTGHTPAVAVSSAKEDEGKSVITAGLAATFAARGMKVLVVDADVFRQRQRQLLLGDAQGQTPHETGNTLFWIQVQPRIDLMTLSDSQLDPARLLSSIRAITQHYDIVLVDTPPVLKIADTLALARMLDGLLMVVSVGTPQAQVERLVSETQRLGVRPLGFVMNRSRGASNSDYGYGMPGAALSQREGGRYDLERG